MITALTGMLEKKIAGGICDVNRTRDVSRNFGFFQSSLGKA